MRIPAHTSLSTEAVPEGHLFNSPEHGAEVQFRGVVRDVENGRPISGLRVLGVLRDGRAEAARDRGRGRASA